MKTALLILAVMACCAVNGCAPRYLITVAGPQAASAETELIIYELVIRNLVADGLGEKMVLVSFGKSWIDHVDPPEGFFDRLADLEMALKPISKRSQVSDPAAMLVELRLSEWTSESEASVSVTRYRFGVGASDGFTARVKWSNGVWRLSKITNHWGT